MGWATFTIHPQPWGLPCILISELGRMPFPFGVERAETKGPGLELGLAAFCSLKP